MYSYPQVRALVNPLSEVQFTVMLSISIILLMTICVATGNLDSKQTGVQITVQPDTKRTLLRTITSLNQFCSHKAMRNEFGSP